MILFLGTLIFTIIIHELAHFLASGLVNCRAEVVNIGFGKPIYSFYWGHTRYNITPILLGGYVRLEGELEASNSPTAFVNLTYRKKIFIAFAGCMINIILGCATIYLGRVCNNYSLYYIGVFNNLAGIGNLIPIPGLDGSYPILLGLEKLMKKEKAILIMNKIIKECVRIFIILNIILVPLWIIFGGIQQLHYVVIMYWRG